jgi:hypothetical protein
MSYDIFRVIKSRIIIWADHVARVRDRRVYTGFWWGKLRERVHWRDQGVDGKIILRWILRKWDVGSTDWIDLAKDRDRWRAFVFAVMNLRVT